MGYVGPVVVEYLKSQLPKCYIAGHDIGYFAHCLTGQNRFPESLCDVQYFGDIRDLSTKILEGFDAVILLAAISNDPMGSKYEKVTEEINKNACINLLSNLDSSKRLKVVFASSCSMYGTAGETAKKETDVLNPLTAYARSKVETERMLERLDNSALSITSLRFATACGVSSRLRLDLVLNDFVASAVSSKTISVLSDGTPWRPLINVKDMARAIHWAILREHHEFDRYLAVNVGSNIWNYQVSELAEAVAKKIPGTEVQINKDAQSDKRSYKVDFSLFERLARGYLPTYNLENTIDELKYMLEEMKFNDARFRQSQFIRLKVLERHQSKTKLNKELRWI